MKFSIICVYLTLVSSRLDLALCGCNTQDWMLSFDRRGLSSCSDKRLLRGFFRADRESNDYINLLESAQCCNVTPPWKWDNTLQTVYTDWYYTLDSNYKWALCPSGYFLRGLYRSGGNGEWHGGRLYHIEEGQCTKPEDHPNYYGHCYYQDISSCFDNQNLCGCKDNYFITGLHRGGCDSLYCLDQLRCCEMASKPETLDELSKVKTHIMDTTMSNMAYLAHYLGYGWPTGCKAQYIGEDFRRQGDTWVADKSRRCEGYRNDHRLSMAYGDWSFAIKDIKYGDPIIDELVPQVVDTGILRNRQNSSVTETITRSETVVRSVRHTKTSSWKFGFELGISVEFRGVAGFSFKSSFENSETTEDSSGKEDSKTFTRTSEIVLPPHSSAQFKSLLSNTRTTIPYTATILMKFSTELRGFLRWGHGYNGDSTNYHYQHRGSGDRPTFHYKFGDSNTPFYSALKSQSEMDSLPWQWSEMKSRYSNAEVLINDLTDENNYIFTLTGKFESVEGKDFEVIWDDAKDVRKRSAGHENQQLEENVMNKNLTNVAKAGPDDLPVPDPPPPEVDIHVNRSNITYHILAAGDWN